MVRHSFQSYFTGVNPDIVMSVHPILNHSGLSMLREVGISCPFITIVTDLTTVHPAWIYPAVTRCLVSTGIARDQAIAWGMPAAKVTVCGQPVSPRFIISNNDKQRARQALGLEPTCPTVLITGGGEGDSRIFDIAQKLVCSVSQAQLLVVTGRNHHLRRRLEALTRSKRLRLYGFVDNMPELMQAADILITKAGPGTISEALVTGLPMILYGYIPGQEEGNIAYIQKHQAGVYVEHPTAIAKLVWELTTSQRGILAQMAQNATNLAYPLASYRIAEQVYRLVNQAAEAEMEFRG